MVQYKEYLFLTVEPDFGAPPAFGDLPPDPTEVADADWTCKMKKFLNFKAEHNLLLPRKTEFTCSRKSK